MNWESRALVEVSEIITGSTPPTNRREYYGGQIPFVSPVDLGYFEPITETVSYLSQLGATVSRPVPKDAVLVCCIGATIGKVGIAGVDLVTNQQINSVVFDEKLVDPRFGYHFCRNLKKTLEHMASSTTIPIVNKSRFGQIFIPLPPLREQRKIAHSLDLVESVRNKYANASARTEHLIRSTFLHLFGDPVTNPKNWNKAKLADLIVGKPNNGIFRRNVDYGSGLPVVWVEELYRGLTLDIGTSRQLQPSSAEINKYGLKKGDILFCRSSLKLDGIGFNCIYDGEDDEALFECHLIRISPNQKLINPFFLNYQLRTPNMRNVVIAQSNTVTMTTMSQEDVSNIEVIVPPLDSQQKFERVLRKILILMKKLETAQSLSADLYNTLAMKTFRRQH